MVKLDCKALHNIFENQLKGFRKEISELIKDFGRSQIENTIMIRNVIYLIKDDITDMKNKSDILIAENNKLKIQIEYLKYSINDTQRKVKILENSLLYFKVTRLDRDKIMHEV